MRVGIVGLGLIGTSIGLGLRRWDAVHEIVGQDGFDDHERQALRSGAVDACVDLERLASSDLVFVAVPPDAVVPILTVLERHRDTGTIVTDCAGVKATIAKWARGRNRKSWFVPGHPMGGTEHSGPAHADDSMFDGKAWLLTPPKGGGKTAYYTVEAAVRALGAHPIKVDAAVHDAQIALVSHLPHVLAGAMLVLADRPATRVPGGGSWRDATRVGGSNPELWAQLTLANRRELMRALGELSGELATVRTALRRKNAAWLTAYFAKAAEAKRKGAGN